MLTISNTVHLADWEIDIAAIRAQGAGGQNVNKVSSAIHLRFNIKHSTLPDIYKEKLLCLSDQRINKDGIIIIKAQQFRTQEKNKHDALHRLKELIKAAVVHVKKRKPRKPSRAAKARRLDKKTLRGKTKSLRKKVDY